MAVEARIDSEFPDLMFLLRERSMMIRVIQVGDGLRRHDIYDHATRIGTVELDATTGQEGGMWKIVLLSHAFEMSGIKDGMTVESTLIPGVLFTDLGDKL